LDADAEVLVKNVVVELEFVYNGLGVGLIAIQEKWLNAWANNGSDDENIPRKYHIPARQRLMEFVEEVSDEWKSLIVWADYAKPPQILRDLWCDRD
jgi:hypothetical protein